MMSGRIERDSARYRIGPLTMYVDVADLEKQFRRARANEQVTYAVGPCVTLTAPTAALVRSWHDQGLCYLRREREEGGQGFRYFVQKRIGATTKVNLVSAAFSIRGRPEAKLLEVLVAVAERGVRLPSLDMLADRADLPSRNAADYRLRLLIEGGFVRVRRVGIDRYVDILKQEPAL